MNNSVPTRILHFELIEKLGQGRNGEVFKAYDTELQRTVALKLLRESAESSLHAQWRGTLEVLSKVHHGNVAELFAVDEFEERAIVVSEYIEGRTLREIIGKVPFSDKRLLTFATQSAQGLKALHDRCISHGNITATNLMLDNNNIVKLLDYGIYHSTGGPTTYPPKEADLYWLGVLLYSLAVSSEPGGNEARSASEGLQMGQTLDLNLLESAGLERDSCLMIGQLLAQERVDRFSNIDALLTTLHEMAEFKRSLVTVDQDQPRPIPRRKYLTTALLAVCLIVFWLIISTYNR